ncbi:hypothetical protein M2324_004101, partial [Rhodovulum sulfidophilum]|nr:hypothetical protein [Rhodovulum sulfidophilum]
MAGEYSLELSVKVCAGQCRLIKLGFRQGGAAGLPEPLLSRCPPIALRALTTDELVMFIWREGRRQGTSDVALDAAVEAFKR